MPTTYQKEIRELEFLITKIASRHGIGAELISWERLPDVTLYFVRYVAVPDKEYSTHIYPTGPSKILSLRQIEEKRFLIRLKLYPYILLDKANLKDYEAAVHEKVEQLHSLGISHGDLHEENIVIDEEDNVKLIDFGLSKFERSNDDFEDLKLMFR